MKTSGTFRAEHKRSTSQANRTNIVFKARIHVIVQIDNFSDLNIGKVEILFLQNLINFT